MEFEPPSDDVILNSFECVDTFIANQSTFDNALISLQNSSTPADVVVEKPVRTLQPSLRENLMQHLTNLRFRFNDGQLIKHVAYPEVKIDGGTIRLFS